MNVLTRLQSRGDRSPLEPQTSAARRTPLRSAFELHVLSEDGFMAGQWDGDARQPRRPSTSASFRPARVEEEVVVEEPSIFWG